MVEENKLMVAIPTFKRANRLVGKDYFRSAAYVLPESQRDQYLKVLPSKRMIVIPDDQDGSIAKKRNWILRNLSRPVLMVDDDVRCLIHTESMEGRGKPKQMIELTPEQAEGFIINGFNLAHEWGCVLWGVKQNTDGRNYKQYAPLKLTKVILGPFQGHLEHDLLMDERMGTKEDYDFSLQVLRKYKKVLRFDKFAYYCEHGENEGGIVSTRTMESEMEFNRRIMAKWGRGVIRYPEKPKKMADVLNGRVFAPIRGL